jgi:hypothetical protein
VALLPGVRRQKRGDGVSDQPLTPDQIAALWQDISEWLDYDAGSVTDARRALDRLHAEMSRQAARVAALEAELAAMRDGLTGPPKKAGRYWCDWETPPGAHWIHICKCRHEAWWEHDQGWIDSDGDKIGTPTRYWPLPGEVYQ